MATTTFVDGQTRIVATWLQDVNDFVYAGTYPTTSLDAIADVVITTAASNDWLTYNGTNWVNSPIAFDNLSDVIVTNPVAGQSLQYNGSTWVNIVPQSTVPMFNIADYGAVSDGAYVSDAVTSSSTTLISATAEFVSGDVGKYVLVRSGSNQLITTIAAYVAADQVTMTDAASFTATSCELYWGTDDTAAVQAAIDAAAVGGGIVYIPSAMTIIAGSLQDVTNANSQLVLPSLDAATEYPISITIMGERAPYNVASVTRTVLPTITGSILVGMLNAGTGGALLGGKRTDGGFTNLYLEIDNLLVRMPDNPVLTALDLEKIAAVHLNHVSVDSGTYSDSGPSQPTTATSFGIKLPGPNNGVENTGNIFVNGFYNAVKIGEHCSFSFMQFINCINGLVVSDGPHGSRIRHIVSQRVGHHIVSDGTGAGYLAIGLLNIEHGESTDPAWIQTTYVVDDSANYINGDARFHIVNPGVAIETTIAKNGGGNFATRCNEAGIIGASVTRTANQTINASTLTALAFTAEAFDTDGCHDNSTNNSRLTCKTAGTYTIRAEVQFAANTTGTYRVMQIVKNGGTNTPVQAVSAPMGGSSRTKMSCMAIVQLAIDDYLEVQVLHDASSSLDIIVASGVDTPMFSIVRL